MLNIIVVVFIFVFGVVNVQYLYEVSTYDQPLRGVPDI